MISHSQSTYRHPQMAPELKGNMGQLKKVWGLGAKNQGLNTASIAVNSMTSNKFLNFSSA